MNFKFFDNEKLFYFFNFKKFPDRVDALILILLRHILLIKPFLCVKTKVCRASIYRHEVSYLDAVDKDIAFGSPTPGCSTAS